MGGRSRSPQKKGFRKDDKHEGNKGVSKSQSASQNMMEVEASGSGEVRNLTKIWRAWGVLPDLCEKIGLTEGTGPRIKGLETWIRDVKIQVP